MAYRKVECEFDQGIESVYDSVRYMSYKIASNMIINL